MNYNKVNKLIEFFNKYKDLPEQNSKQWLEDRKFFIGGSEMGTIAGKNPFKNIRGLIENHLGLAPFSGNINTYWGSVLEDYTIQIFEKEWNCTVKETGSLPGVIDEQKYSPDGIVYIDFLDQIVLLEIKNAVRRITNGKVPASYKPQIFTGLATISIADRALFIDCMFRRCSISDYNFTHVHDLTIHKITQDDPIALGAVFIYENKYSGNYDDLKTKYNEKYTFIDGGICDPDDLAIILSDVKDKKLIRHFTPCEYNSNNDLVYDFISYGEKNDYTPICLLPLKLFKFEIVPVERNDWKKTFDRKSKKYIEQETDFSNYVESHAETIKHTISVIKELDGRPEKEISSRLNEIYPEYRKNDETHYELIKNLIEYVV